MVYVGKFVLATSYTGPFFDHSSYFDSYEICIGLSFVFISLLYYYNYDRIVVLLYCRIVVLCFVFSAKIIIIQKTFSISMDKLEDVSLDLWSYCLPLHESISANELLIQSSINIIVMLVLFFAF